MEFLKGFFEKINFEKSADGNKRIKKLPSMQRVNDPHIKVNSVCESYFLPSFVSSVIMILKDFFFKKSADDNKRMKNYLACKELMTRILKSTLSGM